MTHWQGFILAALPAAFLAACLLRSRIREALYRAERDAARVELARERATVEAARRLYGEARTREAVRLVAMREKPEGEE